MREGAEEPRYTLSEEAAQQRNQRRTDACHTASGHQLYDGEVVVKREFSEYRKTLPNRTA